MNKSIFEVGQLVTFVYHDKQRYGQVEKVGETAVTLRLSEDADGKAYKAFSYSKIVPDSIVTTY